MKIFHILQKKRFGAMFSQYPGDIEKEGPLGLVRKPVASPK
jgi:hypothetical protein